MHTLVSANECQILFFPVKQRKLDFRLNFYFLLTHVLYETLILKFYYF